VGVREGLALGVERLDRLLQLVLADRLVAHLRLLEDVVDDLLLEEGGADLLQRLGVLLHELEELPLLAGILPRLGEERALQLLVGDGDVVLGADLGQEQAEADPPLGELAVLLGRLDGVVVVALVVVVLLVPELVGDLPRLDVDEGGGRSKLTRSSSASIRRRLRIWRLAWAYSSPRRVRICPLSASRVSAP